MSEDKKYSEPPKVAEWAMRKIFPDRGWFTSLGDFREEYSEIAQNHGVLAARLWYWWEFLRSMIPFIVNIIYWGSVMLKYYLKFAVRNMKRQRAYSFINLAGLAVGMSCCIMILLYVDFELTYDKFHKNGSRIYRFDTAVPYRNERIIDYRSTTYNVAPALVRQYPEIESAVRIKIKKSPLINIGKKRFYEEWIHFAGPQIFELFNLPLEKGSPRSALSELHSVVIGKEMAEKYFGDEEPIGKTLSLSVEKLNTHARTEDEIYVQEVIQFTVTGVLQQVPPNSYFSKINLLATLESIRTVYDPNFILDSPTFSTYLLLQRDTPVSELSEKLNKYNKQYGPKLMREGTVSLMPFNRIHLSNQNLVKELCLFSAVAFLLLLIACINFMNLSTARSAARSKEIGVKKVIGAKRSQLINQFLVESLMFSLLALVLALILVKLFLPMFSSLIDKNLQLNYLENWRYLAGLGVLMLFVGMVSGSYPALFLSSFRPLDVLRKAKAAGLSRSTLRKTLVVIQFAISITLIVSTLIISQQLFFIRNTDLGFDQENIMVIPIHDRNIMKKFESFKEELLQNQDIIRVSTSLFVPPDEMGIMYVTVEGQQSGEEIRVDFPNIDYDFFDTFGIELIAGRNFSPEFPTDIDNAVIINETAARAFGFKEPLGKQIFVRKNPKTIIGIAKDFHARPMYLNIEPLVFFMMSRLKSSISIKVRSENVSGLLAFLEKKWKELSPNYPFEYSFIDDNIDAEYRSEEKLGHIFIYSALLAIGIACLGLFGLTLFTTEQRTKEIGIRKILGASVSRLVLLLVKEFSKWVLIANVIAWPVAYWAMNKWLQDFAYHIDLGWEMFIIGAVLALLIALASVCYQVVKAARSNPANALRYE